MILFEDDRLILFFRDDTVSWRRMRTLYRENVVGWLIGYVDDQMGGWMKTCG